MEATGSDGGRRPSLPWCYRGDQIRSNNPCDNRISSSSSGTIVSATYATSSGCSRLSSMSMDAVSHIELALDEDTELGQPNKKSRKEREEGIKHMDILSLVQEFFCAPSAEGSINTNSGGMSVLERWFSELDVAWVIHLHDGDDASAELHQTSAATTERWIHGLNMILVTICSTPQSDKQVNNVLDRIRVAFFIEEAMLKILSFVDFTIRQVVVCINVAPYEKLQTLLAVYKTLTDGSDREIWRSIYDLARFGMISQETINHLSEKREKAGDAIWSTMEHISTYFLECIDKEYGDNSSSSPIPQASSDIHKATLSLMEYITFMCSNFSSMCQIVSRAVKLGKYVPQIKQEQPLKSMIMDMKACLQEKLVKISESFPDQGLRFLFLLNNIEFIRQSLVDSHFWHLRPYYEEGKGLLALSEKVEGYMENYLQACWEPVLSCLFSPTPLCLGINHSPLLKFESEFKKTYATQKLWKVPDLMLRKRLRTAITNKIVPRYTENIEENNITTPGVAPQDLENMLEELFEG